jgi:hypothetical protein
MTMNKDELHHRLTNAEAFKAGQRSGIHLTLTFAAKLAARIVIVIALGMIALAVFA